jgi:hypothetical protein
VRHGWVEAPKGRGGVILVLADFGAHRRKGRSCLALTRRHPRLGPRLRLAECRRLCTVLQSGRPRRLWGGRAGSWENVRVRSSHDCIGAAALGWRLNEDEVIERIRRWRRMAMGRE